jgi:hypothetical protein
MKRLAIAILLVATNAGAATKIADLPVASNAAELSDMSVVSRYEGAWANQCLLTTVGDHGIALRWLSAENAIERTAFSMYRKDDMQREAPQWAYEPIIRVESVTKISPAKVAERTDMTIWAYREANAVVLFVPGKSGGTVTTGTQRSLTGCLTATAVLSTKPSSECKTTAGCGRLAQIVMLDRTITAGVSEGALSVSMRVLTASN